MGHTTLIGLELSSPLSLLLLGATTNQRFLLDGHTSTFLMTGTGFFLSYGNLPLRAFGFRLKVPLVDAVEIQELNSSTA